MIDFSKGWKNAKNSPEVVEFSFREKDFAWVVMGKKVHESTLRTLSPGEVAELLLRKDPQLWSDSVLKCGLQISEIEQVRMIGPADTLEKVRALFSSAPFPWGKDVVISVFPTGIQFLPAEGRIRLAKADAKKVTAQPTSYERESPVETKKRVLVVDDSETIRKLLSQIIEGDPDLECVGTVANPLEVDAAIQKLKPDVVTLDIHMPEMNGVELLKKEVIPKHRLPAVMISSLSKEDGTFVLDALEAGAVDYIQKPSMKELDQAVIVIREKIKSAASSKVFVRPEKSSFHTRPKATAALGQPDPNFLIAIGSSTGGTEALKVVLTSLPEKIPPIVIVQHIPPVFSKAFADRMNDLCPFEVKEAQDGDVVKPGRVLIAPGGFQMRLKEIAGELKVIVEDAPPMNRHKPSVDYMFDSIAAMRRKRVVGVILTGMGADGAKGLLKLKQAGAYTIGQDEESCVVYGMPREAAKIGAVMEVVTLTSVAEAIVKQCQPPVTQSRYFSPNDVKLKTGFK